MRRQARQARKAGMQPMMFISGDGFPTPLGVILARGAWRYRSEIAPAAVTCAVLAAGAWTHAAHPHWWPYLIAVTALATGALAVLGARAGLVRLAERLYAATTVLAAGSWLAAACLLGPLASPLPQVLGLGWLALSVPWWTSRRRRSRVRVERAIAAWPEIARAVGLMGSEVMSATVDLWGWRARLRLARGQTIADVQDRIPALESGLGTQRNAVRISPTPDDLANRCELRVLDRDPHADAIPWPGPSVTSITQPIDLGPFEDAEECRVSFLRRHALIGGATGSGKSGGLNGLMGNLVACRDVAIWGIDLKRGMELRPWEPCLNRLATTPGAAARLLEDAVAILLGRADSLASIGRREWQPSPQAPALVIIIDEYAELAEQSPDAMADADSIARLGRAVAVTLVAATQRPTQKVMGQGAVRSQMDVRISFRVREQRDVDLVLGQGMRKAGWLADKLNAPGKFFISAPGNDIPRRARAYLLTDGDVQDAVARCAPARPELDGISDDALFAGLRGRTSAPDPGTPEAPLSEPEQDQEQQAPETVLRHALSDAPEGGLPVSDLIAATGMSRRWVFYRLRQLAADGYAVQTARGYWRAA
jgi:S-DNA-T family DNA segregation ATPase FtsK/SpoIIIE